MAINNELRLPDARAERINDPSNPNQYWRYRMHLSLEQLLDATAFNETVRSLIQRSDRL
jgi:4-alpha-glucanotransferase